MSTRKQGALLNSDFTSRIDKGWKEALVLGRLGFGSLLDSGDYLLTIDYLLGSQELGWVPQAAVPMLGAGQQGPQHSHQHLPAPSGPADSPPATTVLHREHGEHSNLSPRSPVLQGFLAALTPSLKEKNLHLTRNFFLAGSLLNFSPKPSSPGTLSSS